MEVGSELLWKATSAILLCFLVARLVSLVISFSTPPTEVLREKGCKRISTLDLDLHLDHHVGHKKQQKKMKMVKFVDQAAKMVDFANEVQVKTDFATENLAGISDLTNKIQVRGGFDDVGPTENREDLVGISEGWEGVERSELEREFGRAKVFVDFAEKEGRLSMIGNDMIMQLYGLMKIAMEGPCYEPQPMPFKLSARAKWNAWQRLGNTSPEEAMEKYISLLSDIVPSWMDSHSSVAMERPSKEEAHVLLDADTNVHFAHQPTSISVRTSELSDLTDITMPVNKGKDNALNINDS